MWRKFLHYPSIRVEIYLIEFRPLEELSNVWRYVDENRGQTNNETYIFI